MQIKIRFIRWCVEGVVTLLSLPYFLITLITPQHFVEFMGAGIVCFALVRNLYYLWKIRDVLEQENLPAISANRFLLWYLVPIFIGMSLIYISDLLTSQEYTIASFAKDFGILISLNIFAIIIDKNFKNSI